MHSLVWGVDADRGEDSTSLKLRQTNELVVRATHTKSTKHRKELGRG
jgi:hypothetical protein